MKRGEAAKTTKNISKLYVWRWGTQMAWFLPFWVIGQQHNTNLFHP
jgi:hypothetical protein